MTTKSSVPKTQLPHMPEHSAIKWKPGATNQAKDKALSVYLQISTAQAAPLTGGVA